MAKTKFLDYTGLAKLVEKIKNTYVNKNEQYEANLKWGGRNFAASYGPIDAAMISELGANRFAFGYPRGITVEYSNDGGSTWHDYGASDEQKLRLTTTGSGFTIGKVKSSTPENDMLRITFDTSDDNGINCYSDLNKFVIKISTLGSSGCYCKIQKATQANPTTYVDVVTSNGTSVSFIDGWPGYNIINTETIRTYGNQPQHYLKLRFIFGNTGNTTDYQGLTVSRIYAFGGAVFNTPSAMADNGHLYYYDYNKNAIFPANVKATNFIGTLQGNANSASKLGTATVGGATKPMYLNGGTPTACTYTLAQNVTSASKLTDTTYSASTGLSLSKDNKFSINAATSSTIGGVKIGSGITVDTGGTISLTKTNVTNALGYTPPTADTNTHYTTGLIVGNSSSSTGNTAVTTNGVFLNLKDDNTIRNSHKIVGSGATTVTSDSGGTITISSTAYKDATISEHGLMTAADKVKLNSLAKVATSGSYADLSNKPTIPTSLPANGGKADSATQDSSGQKITSTYIKGLSVNGTTITYTKGDNSSGTINTQDTNTTYTFTNGTDGTFTVKASNSTKAQTISVGKTVSASTADNAVNAQTAETANKLSVNAGSDMTPIYFKDGVPKPCDSTLGVNINGRANSASLADNLSIKAGSVSADDVLVIGNYAGGPIFVGGGIGPGKFTPTDIIEKDGDYYPLNVSKANTANSASKLNIGTTGTSTKPVYFNNGLPATCTYELNKTVPSTAVFTDTKYTLSGDGTNKVTIIDSNQSQQSITINDVQKATVATYAYKYSYNDMDRDFVYDVVDGGNHYIRCKDATIIRANGTNLNKYEFIINSDGKGGCYIYDGDKAKGTTWSPDGIFFEKAPANSLVAANGTFATAISDTDIKNAINSAIDWTTA